MIVTSFIAQNIGEGGTIWNGRAPGFRRDQRFRRVRDNIKYLFCLIFFSFLPFFIHHERKDV